MSDPRRVEFDNPLTVSFHDDVGNQLELAVVAASTGIDGFGHPDRRVEVLVTGMILGLIDQSGAFHFDADVRPAALRLDHERSAGIELRLSAESAGSLSEDPDRFARELIDDSTAPLRRTEAWFITRLAEHHDDQPVETETIWEYVTPTESGLPNSGSMVEGSLAFLREHVIDPDTPFLDEAIRVLMSTMIDQTNDPVASRADAHQFFDRWAQASGDERSLAAARFASEMLLADPPASVRDPLAAVQQMLTDWEVDSATVEGVSAVAFAVLTDYGRVECLADVGIDDSLVVYFLAPATLPIERVPDAFEWACGVNRELRIGNFDVDSRSGEVTFRYGIDLGNAALSQELLRSMVLTGLEAIDDHLAGLLQLGESAQ